MRNRTTLLEYAIEAYNEMGSEKGEREHERAYDNRVRLEHLALATFKNMFGQPATIVDMPCDADTVILECDGLLFDAYQLSKQDIQMCVIPICSICERYDTTRVNESLHLRVKTLEELGETLKSKFYNFYVCPKCSVARKRERQ